MFRSLWIDGRATLTIVASRMTMNCATQTRQRTSHGLLFLAVTVCFYQTTPGLRFSHGQEAELDPGGAAEDARRLHVFLPRLRLRLALLPRGRGRAAGRVPALRRRDAPSLPRVLGAVPVRVRGRVRGM